MRKKIFIWLFLCVGIVGLVGCVPKAPVEPPAPTISATDAEQNARLGNVEGRINSLESGKANDSSVAALTSRVTTLEGQASDSTYTKSQLYTQAEIDALLEDLRDDLEGTSSSTSDEGTTGDYGVQIDSDRDLELWLERTDPSSDPMYLSDGGDNAEFEITVVNTEDTYHEFRLYLRMTPKVSVACAKLDTEITSYPGTGAWTITRDDWDNNANEGGIYFSMNSDGTIGKSNAEDYLLAVTIAADADYDTFWNYRLTIEQMD